MLSPKACLTCALFFLCICGAAEIQAAQPAFPEVMFILDGSGSMWGEAGSSTKIETAKQVLNQVVPELPAEVRFGLVAYGHRRKGDCSDVETLIPAGSNDRQALLGKVMDISPKGKTPIAASIAQVAETLKTKENETTIVLVSDGVETCHDAPCEAVKALSASGIKFVLHVVGFGVDDAAREQLACLAEAGGGRFFYADDAGSLLAALQSVQQDVEVKVEQAKTTTVKKATGLGKLEIVIPEQTARSLSGLRILKVPDGGVLKETKEVTGTHPLPAGEYEVVLLFAQPNYRDPDPVSLGKIQVPGGETTTLTLGGLNINIAPELTGAVAGVVVVDQASDAVLLTHHSPDNDYYMFKPRALPEGSYILKFLYGNTETAMTVVRDIEITAGAMATATIDSGIRLEEAPGVQAWELVQSGSGQTVLRVQRRWDNDYPLWKGFPVPPGTYDLRVEIEGMTEPLPVGQGLEIKQGETVVFATGL